MMGMKYWQERLPWYGWFGAQVGLMILLGAGLGIMGEYVVMVVVSELAVFVTYEVLQYRKRQMFYRQVMETLEELEEKYLMAEVLDEPEFYEGKLLCDVLYETNKATRGLIHNMEYTMKDFKEYVEMWIHEIKIPISALSLMIYNENTDMKAYRKQLGKIRSDVEQILYYARAGAPQKDFVMKDCSLDAVINHVLKEQKESLIEEHFTIDKKGTDVSVVSDAKWLEFMLGQVVNNSTKYKRGNRGYLGFSVEDEDKWVRFTVEDHGIGIPARDVDNVFDKAFTGTNGHNVAGATGMGLYICHKMCGKLGHEISLESKEGEGTKVTFLFGKESWYV